MGSLRWFFFSYLLIHNILSTNTLYAKNISTLSGKIKVYIVDDFEAKKSSKVVSLLDKSTNSNVTLNIKDKDKDHLYSGINLRVKGYKKGSQFDVGQIEYLDPQGQIITKPGSYFKPTPVIGEVKTLYLLVKANDSVIPDITNEEYKTKIADQMDLFLRQASYGQAWMNSDIRGWYSMGVASMPALTPDGCISYIKDQLNADNVNIDNYTKVVCVTWGVGGGVAYFPGKYAKAGVYRAVTDKDFIGTIKTLSHELGHTFGLNHAASAYCHSDIAICEQNNATDSTDTMGYASARSGYYSSMHKDRLGWLETQKGSAYVKTISSSGNYTINAYTTGNNNTEILKIPLGVSGESRIYYYISYKVNQGFDSTINDSRFEYAPLIHLSFENDFTSYLITNDISPQFGDFGPSIYPSSNYSSLFEAKRSLSVGKVYRDPSNRFSIKTLSVDGAQAQVEIILGDNIHPEKPEIIISNPSSNIKTVEPGSVYTATVSATVGAGVSLSTIDFIRRESNGSMTTICSDTTAPYSCDLPAPLQNNEYKDFIILATDSSGQVSKPYNLRLSTDQTAPICSISNLLNNSTVTPGTSIRMEVTCTDNDLTSFTSRGYELYVNNELISSSNANYSYRSGYPVVLGWVPPAIAIDATYNIEVRVWDQGGNKGVATVTLQAGAGGLPNYDRPQISMDLITPSFKTNQVVYLDYRIDNPILNLPLSSYKTKTYINNKESFLNSSPTISKYLVLGQNGQSLTFASKAWDNSNLSGNLSNTLSYTLGSNTCVRAKPTVSISSNSSGVQAGSSLIYQISITNNDSLECSNSTFNLSSILPTGFSSQFAVNKITLAPGSKGGTGITVTSSNTATNGTYTFSVKVINESNASLYSTGSSTYTVFNNTSCAQSSPSVSISSQPSAVTAGTTEIYTVTILNNDSADCSPSTYNLSNGVSVGLTAALSTYTLILAPKSSQTVSLSVTSSTSLSSGTYQFQVFATNSTNSNLKGSATGYYSVKTGKGGSGGGSGGGGKGGGGKK